MDQSSLMNSSGSPNASVNVITDKPLSCADCLKDGGEDCFECGLCGLWLHFACANVAKKNIRPISDNDRILIVCKNCSDFALRRRLALSSISVLPSLAPVLDNDRLSAMEKQLSEVVATLQQIAPAINIGTSASEESPGGTNQAASYASIAAKGVTSTARIITVDDFNKAREDESHRRSLVVAGLPENGHDLEDVSRMVKYLDCSASVSEVFRMGRVGNPNGDGTDHPRLLKVHVASSSVVKSLLSQARRLKDSGDFKGVYIRRSMSLEERRQLVKLRDQCRSLNVNEPNVGVKYVVLNEKIVKFVNCSSEGERLVGGVRDNSWSHEVLN